MTPELQEKIDNALDLAVYPRASGQVKYFDRGRPGTKPGSSSEYRYEYLGSEQKEKTEPTTPHVVTPVEEMLRSKRPSGKTSDPRQKIEVASREAVAGFAYLLADEHDRVKIGAATDVLQRRADLQVGNADDLTILDVIRSDDMFALEAALKAHYRYARVRGEWFRRDAVEPFFGTEGLS